MTEDEDHKKQLYEKKRTRLQRIGPHELKPLNRRVVAAIFVAVVAAMVGGWYVTHGIDRAPKASQKAE